MPATYIAGKISASVKFDSDDDFTYQEWTDSEIASRREKNKKSNLGLWLEIENPADPVSPFSIPVNDADVYDGKFEATQQGLTFNFTFDAKAKCTVHKSTKEKIDLGAKPKLTGLIINGQQYAVELDIDVVTSSKKL